MVTCPECKGSGEDPDAECPDEEIIHQVVLAGVDQNEFINMSLACILCAGSGKVPA